jgi:putative ABC transport system substrate-binding protein
MAKNNKKWILGVLLIAVLIGAVFFLNYSDENNNSHRFKVGIFQVVRHPVLDSMAVSFEKSLSESLSGDVSFVTMVPEGDTAKTEQMAQKFASENYDLVFVIGTNLAQSLAKKTENVPIVLGAATDPESADLVESWERPGKNVTGTSDLSPIDAQLEYLQQIMPNASRIGIVYNPSEDNSEAIFSHFKKECLKRNLTPVSATINNQNDIKQTVVSLVGKIDVLYAPTDATLQSAFPLFIKVANEVKMPVFNCDEGTVKQGAIFSVGFNYSDLGVLSASMAAKILLEKANPANMPIRLIDKYNLFYNEESIKQMGLTLPESWKTEGTKVSE